MVMSHRFTGLCVSVGLSDGDVPQVHRAMRVCRASMAVEVAGDDAHIAVFSTRLLLAVGAGVGENQGGLGNVLDSDTLVPGRDHLLFLWQVQPDLTHLKHSPAL